MKKKYCITFLLITVFSFARNWDGSTLEPTTKEIEGVEYYVITTPSELAWFAYQVNEKNESKINAILGNDIHFMDDDSLTSNIPSSTIGKSSANPYDGIFDGAGYTIYGLYSKGSIFGYTGENFVLKNFSVKKSDVVTFVALNYGVIENCVEENDGAKQVAGFAYTNYGTIRNCSAKNFGIAYTNRGLIEKSNSSGAIGAYYSSYFTNGGFNKIEERTDRAGIVYENYGRIKKCSFEPKEKMIVDEGNFGGIALYAGENSIIENCLFEGKISLVNSSSNYFKVNFGGIVARNSENAEIINSMVRIDSLVVKGIGYGYIGGIAGHVYGYTSESSKGSTISGSVANVYVDSLSFPNYSGSSDVYVGGIAGFAYLCDINNSRANLFVTKGVNLGSKNTLHFASLVAHLQGESYYESRLNSSYGIIQSEKDATNYMYGGIVFEASYSHLSNIYYDKNISTPDTISAVGNFDGHSTLTNVAGQTTAVMQSPAFVETLNTNAGLDDDSGIWKYCEGNYPILVSEGTCEEFYSQYGLSNSSQLSSSSVASSGSTSVKSCSSGVTSSSEESSSSEKNSSSKAESSSSEGTTVARNAARPKFNLVVEGRTLTLSYMQGGVVRIFDALGHIVAAKSTSEATTRFTLQTPGNYIIRINGISEVVPLK